MSKSKIKSIQLVLLTVSTALLGISMILMGHHRHIELVTDFYGISGLASGELYNAFAAVGFALIAVLGGLCLFGKPLQKWLGIAIVAVSIPPLLSLFSGAMWLDELGGFPAISSGQGIIKYFALLALGIMLLQPANLSNTTQKALAIFPVVLVLVWIGGMKFTLWEAEGIKTLVAGSPLMGWMYQVWDLQMVSNLIGVYDLIAALLLVLSIWFRVLLLPGIAMSGAVMLVTQTFLFTWDGALSAETLLSTGGHFLIKDLWYIGCLLWYWQLRKVGSE